MAKIFLSYASEDEAQVRDMRTRLIEAGFQVWMDKFDILPGQQWQAEIPRAIRESDFILIFFSQSSVAKRGYINREIRLALDTLEEMPPNAIHTIPIRLDSCEIPEQFRFLQWSNLSEEGAFERIVQALRLGVEQRYHFTPKLIKNSVSNQSQETDGMLAENLNKKTQDSYSNFSEQAKNQTYKISKPRQLSGTAIISLIIAVIGAWAAVMVVPEVRRYFVLDRPPNQSEISNPQNPSKLSKTKPKSLPEPELSSFALTIKVVPSDSDVTLVGTNIAYEPGVKLKSGSYVVAVTRDGYQTVTTTISITDHEVEHEIILEPNPPPKNFTNSFGMEFILIPAGTFTMGSPDSDSNAWDDEKPAHSVTINEPFYLGKYEVTQAQWETVMGVNPSKFQGDSQRPVENISWDDVQDFFQRLNAENDGGKYRLPKETEWEYAARAGTTTAYSFGDDSSKFNEYAWCQKNDKQTYAVGKLLANPWGLYDIHGNIAEWVNDQVYKYSEKTESAKKFSSSGSERRVIRGGSSLSGDLKLCRSASREFASRSYRFAGLGFRSAKSVK